MSFLWPQYELFLKEMGLLWAILLLPVGLAILIKGADWLVDGAVAIAKHFGMSPLIIGLTIVAMGTSAPEVAASVKAAIENSPGIAVGNVYGSNIANLALVGGLCAVIRPIAISGAAIRRDLPFMLGSAVLLYILFYISQVLESSGSRYQSLYAYSSSALMLLVFVGLIVFMIYSERLRAKENTKLLEEKESAVEHAAPHQPQSLLVSVLIIVVGLICLAEGADLTVSTAKTIGVHAGWSDGVIGATIVALGTSLPELLTCLIAAFKGHDDLSVGNLVGSNIFNTLLVIGVSGLVRPYAIAAYPELMGASYLWMLAVLVVFSGIAIGFRKISKPSGILLFLGYLLYIAYNLGFFSASDAQQVIQ